MLPAHDILQSASFFAAPLLLAGAGELVVERAGVVNIAIEGIMLAGALAAWIGNAHFGHTLGPTFGPITGFASALAAGVALALLFAIASLHFQADQIVTGTGINLLAFGLTALIYKRVNTAVSEKSIAALSPNWLVLASLLLIALLYLYFARTRAGLELSAIGENPQAADSAGIAVNRRKLFALLFGASCAALAGAYLSTMRVQGFVENMTEGQGFLALAIVIFGRWHAFGILAAAFFFGLVRAIGNTLETQSVSNTASLQLFKLLPYVVSLIALAGVAGRSGSPASLGKPYTRE